MKQGAIPHARRLLQTAFFANPLSTSILESLWKIKCSLYLFRGFLGDASGKRVCLPTEETQVKCMLSLGREDSLEKEMATHSRILAWRIPMDREVWQATDHRTAESGTTEETWHSPICLMLPNTNVPQPSITPECLFSHTEHGGIANYWSYFLFSNMKFRPSLFILSLSLSLLGIGILTLNYFIC